MRSPRTDRLHIESLSELGRDRATILRALVEQGIKLAKTITVEQPLLTESDWPVIQRLLAGVENVERRARQERIKLALSALKRRGRPPRIDAALLVSLRAEGKSWREVACAAGCSVRSARRLVHRAVTGGNQP